MNSFSRPLIVIMLIATAFCGTVPVSAQAQLFQRPQRQKPAAELTKEEVDSAITRATQYLISKQREDGSWSSDFAGWSRYQIGVSSLATLALLNAGMKPSDPPVAKGLSYLRSIKEPQMTEIYEISLMAMALAAAKDKSDIRIIRLIANKLEEGQIKHGEFTGGWSYTVSQNGGGDNSNTQYAVLGLREAAAAGVNVDRAVWERARKHWLNAQSGDGGWNYRMAGEGGSTGSMTAAGIATLVITESMLRDEDDVNPDGTPRCCGGPPPNDALDRGIAWMEQHFTVGSNPFDGRWILYYLYGMERAGRLSGRRFFGQHDWYREGASFLVGNQSARSGSWSDSRVSESCTIVSTSFATLFLSKGLAPVLINKLNYENDPVGDPRRLRAANAPAKVPNWNQHRNDIRNLTEHISNLDKWPKLLTWQQVNLPAVTKQGGVQDLLQAPILYLSGVDAPTFTDEEVALLKRYILEGGFIFAVNNCNGRGFDQGIRDLVRRMYPDGEVELKRLGPQHAVFRSEYILDSEGTELWGIDVGCRTPLIYSPEDYACLWDKVVLIQPPDRPVDFNTRIAKALKVGVNVVAYVTGREPPGKLDTYELTEEGPGTQDQIERGFLQIAKLRHPGDWNAAPSALRHLLVALNKAADTVASTKQRDLAVTDSNLFQYPVLYMHGRAGFQFGSQERKQLVEYLSRGNVLFADACCGAPQFDAAFRELVAELYPDKKFERIPPEHEIFTTKIGYDIRQVKRRVPGAGNSDGAIQADVQIGEPYLEGIEIDGRYVIVYSKFDLSCALERQASVACVGYSHEDAVRIAVNIVRYALLQNISYQGKVERIQ